jgi:hypothetical protein
VFGVRLKKLARFELTSPRDVSVSKTQFVPAINLAAKQARHYIRELAQFVQRQMAVNHC